MPPGHLHRIVAADPPLGLAILRGPRNRKQGRVYLDVWMGAGRYNARECTRLRQMGYTGAEDEGIWVGMVGGDWEGEETLKEESPPPTKGKPPPSNPSVTKTGDKKSFVWAFESDDSSDGADPPPPRSPPQAPTGHERQPRPQDNPPPPKKGWGTVPMTPSSAPKSTSRTPRAWRWAPSPVSTREKRGSCGWNTQITPSSTRWPVASSSPTPKVPKNTWTVFVRAREKPPPPKPLGQLDPKTNPLLDPKTNPPDKPQDQPPD